MGSFPKPVRQSLQEIGANQEGGQWKCPYCSQNVFQGDIVGDQFEYRCCCSQMHWSLQQWGIYSEICQARRGKENLVQKSVPGSTARVVEAEQWTVAGPLEVDTVSKKEASALISQHHRHHEAPHSAILGVQAYEKGWGGEEEIRGVGTLATPTSRILMDKGTHLEVNRLCTWGPKWRRKNAISKMSAQLRDEARRLRKEAQQVLEKQAASGREMEKARRRAGIGRLRTYILEHENGASLRASGWHLVGRSKGGSWSESRSGRSATPQTEGPKWIYDTPL